MNGQWAQPNAQMYKYTHMAVISEQCVGAVYTGPPVQGVVRNCDEWAQPKVRPARINLRAIVSGHHHHHHHGQL